MSTSAPATPELYDFKGGAAYLKCSVTFLRRRVWAKEIGYEKRGRKYIFTREHLDAFRRRSERLPKERKPV